VTFTTRDLDTNAGTICPDNYYLDGDGTCKVDQTGGGSSTSTATTCRYKKFGYYDTGLPWFREVNCV